MKSFEIQSCKFSNKISKTEVVGNMAFTENDFEGQLITSKGTLQIKAIETYILKKVNNKWLIDYFHSTHLSDDPVLAKGSMLGFHVVKKIKLMPGVTQEQADEYLVNTYIPEFNKISTDIKLFATKGLRGAEKDQTGVVYYFASDDVRNKFWESEDKFTKEGEEYFKKFDSLNAEAAKFYTIESTVYTDWVVK